MGKSKIKTAKIKLCDGARIINIEALVETEDFNLMFAGIAIALKKYHCNCSDIESIKFYE